MVKVSRQKIFKRDGYRCLCCGSRKNLTIDHIIPKCKKGGTDKNSNLQTLCRKCNEIKDAHTISFRKNIPNEKRLKSMGYYQAVNMLRERVSEQLFAKTP